MKSICLAVLFCSTACAQKPTISAVSIDSLDTTSFRVFYTATPAGGNGTVWSEVLYGTSSNVYPYNTKSINCYKTWPCQTNGGPTSLMVSGLAPATTYYMRVTARPNPNDDTNICSTSDCGSVELAVTTLNGAQPAAPIAPTAWYPAPPDTSSYVVIPLVAGNSGECQAASSVQSRDRWSVRAGDSVWNILNEIGYGAVLELPQGVACLVPPTMPGGNPGTGYILPSKPLDSNPACGGPCGMTNPSHRWIVFRTRQSTSGDFPPFGARIDPSYAPRLGKFYSTEPNRFTQLFSGENNAAPVHHIWWQNVEFEDDPNYTNPPDYVDPVGFGYFAAVGSQYQSANNQFLVFDRVYTHGLGAPIRHIQGWELGGNYQAMIGCYTAHVESWRLTAWPSTPGTLSNGNNILNIPQNNYRFAANSPLLGMTGAARASLSGVQGAGTVVGNLYKDHLEVQYSASIGAITCGGCVAVAAATPATPPNALQLFSGAVTANGQFNGINWNTQEWQTSRYLMAFGVMFSDLKAPGGPYLFDNNYLDGVGEGYYVDAQYSNFAHDDVTYTHNHHIWPKNYFAGATGNLWRYEVRQHWEIKRGHRYLIKGNLFSWSWSYQNDDPGILFGGRSTYLAESLNDGVSDIAVQSNTISHGRSGITCGNGNPMDNGGNGMEPTPTKRIAITNNVMFDLGRWKYCDPVNCPGLGSFYFENIPGCQDLVITNNTADVTWGEIPALIYLGGGENPGNQLTFQKNILHFSQSQYGPGNFGSWPANNVANHDVRPAPVFNYSSTPPNYKSNLAQAIINTGSSIVPNYAWSNNVLIGGFGGSSMASAADMSYGQVMAAAAQMPPGDIYPSGNTIAARQAAAGLSTVTWRSGVYNPQRIGADIDAQISAMGMVTGVKPPAPAFDFAEFSYTAPDARACAVDVSPDGVTWTRTTDSGGPAIRVVRVQGLHPSTQYQSRIVCYYTQQNDGVLYTDYTPDEITTATFTTTERLPLRQR
jgi:hypothetical protein